jgi:hypothetical protein
MDIPELLPDLRKLRQSNIVQFRMMEPKPVVSLSGRSKEIVREKTRTKWFAKYTRENLTVTEALIRGTLVIIIPVLSAIDWNYGTHAMFCLAPILFYSEVTVFTMTCPIKALLSNYRNPPDNE